MDTIPWVSIPVEVHSLLISSLLNKVKGDYSTRQQGARDHKIHDFVCWIFFQVSLNSLSKQSFLKNPSKLRPCSIWPKMNGCSKTLNFLKLHLLQYYFWSLNMTFSVFEYRNVCLINDIHQSVKQKALSSTLHLVPSLFYQVPITLAKGGVHSSPCPKLRGFTFWMKNAMGGWTL